MDLSRVLDNLKPLQRPVDPPGGSVLLENLICALNLNEATKMAKSTPLLHFMSVAETYIRMFNHVCETDEVIIVLDLNLSI